MTTTQCTTTLYGHLPGGQAVMAHTLQRGALSLTAIDFGGIVTQLWAPDARGQRANVVLGLDTLDGYVQRNPHFGTLTGRLCNRVAQGRYSLDGRTVQLACNDGPHSLHGGPVGFGQRLWAGTVEHNPAQGGAVLCLRLHSEDGDQGHPGAVQAEVRYSLPDEHTWAVHYQATSDAPTALGLTQHAYFNLAGAGSALGHQLRIAASRFDAVDAGLIPEAVCPVDGTPFDLRRPQVVAEGLAQAHPQLARGHGYDHHFHLDAPSPAGSTEPAPAAWLCDPASGRHLTLLTTEPGLQFYSGNFLDGSLPAPGGGRHERGHGLCLEPQHAPNAVNRPDQRAPWLRPGQVWRSCTLYRFGAGPA